MLHCNSQHQPTTHGLQTVAAAKSTFQHLLRDPHSYGRAVLDNVQREYFGHIALTHLNSAPTLIFLFEQWYWDNGMASEALLAFFSKALRELNLQTVRATTSTNYLPALKLLQTLGFQLHAERSDGSRLYYELQFTVDEVTTAGEVTTADVTADEAEDESLSL